MKPVLWLVKLFFISQAKTCLPGPKAGLSFWIFPPFLQHFFRLGLFHSLWVPQGLFWGGLNFNFEWYPSFFCLLSLKATTTRRSCCKKGRKSPVKKSRSLFTSFSCDQKSFPFGLWSRLKNGNSCWNSKKSLDWFLAQKRTIFRDKKQQTMNWPAFGWRYWCCGAPCWCFSKTCGDESSSSIMWSSLEDSSGVPCIINYQKLWPEFVLDSRDLATLKHKEKRTIIFMWPLFLAFFGLDSDDIKIGPGLHFYQSRGQDH